MRQCYLVLHQRLIHLSSQFAFEIIVNSNRSYLLYLPRKSLLIQTVHLPLKSLSIRTVSEPFFSICRGDHCRFEHYVFLYWPWNHYQFKRYPSSLFQTEIFFFFSPWNHVRSYRTFPVNGVGNQCHIIPHLSLLFALSIHANFCVLFFFICCQDHSLILPYLSFIFAAVSLSNPTVSFSFFAAGIFFKFYHIFLYICRGNPCKIGAFLLYLPRDSLSDCAVFFFIFCWESLFNCTCPHTEKPACSF